MIRASMIDVKGIIFFLGLHSYWLVTNEASLAGPVHFSLFIQSGGQLGVAQSLQSRAHRASGHDPVACIKDVACD